MCDSCILQPLNFICSKASPPPVVQIHQLGFLCLLSGGKRMLTDASALNSIIFTAVEGEHPE